MAELIAHHHHGQRRVQIGQVGDRHHHDLRQGDLQQEQRHSQHDADDAGIQQQGAQLQLGAVIGHGEDTVGPCEEREHHHIGGAVEHTDAAEQGGHQGVSHKAAVGEHGTEQHQTPAVGVLLPEDETGQHDKRGMEQQGDPQ